MNDDDTSVTTPPPPSWFERNPKKTSLVLSLLFFACIGFVELLLRLFLPPRLVHAEHVVPHKLYFKNYPANIDFVTYPSAPDHFAPVTNTINSMGVRGPELAPKTQYRILNIGDSFIQADEVPFEDTFGERLNSSHRDLEFISHGIASWSPTTQFSWLYHNVGNINCDEVNLFLCVNDFFTESAYANVDEVYRAHANYGDNGIPISYNVAPPGAILDMARALYLCKAALLVKAKLSSFFKPDTVPGKNLHVTDQIEMLSKDSDTWDRDVRQNVLATLEVVRQMNAFLRDREITLNVLFVPLGLAWADEFTSGKQALSDQWEESKVISQEGIESFTKDFLRESEINYVELSSAFKSFKQQNQNVSLFYDMDGHWNARGHDLVYDILSEHYAARAGPLDDYGVEKSSRVE